VKHSIPDRIKYFLAFIIVGFISLFSPQTSARIIVESFSEVIDELELR
jgi:hypothetical protein